MIDDRIFPPPAAVSEIDSVVNVPAFEIYPRKRVVILNYVVEYLNKWDDYCAEKQAMYAALDEKVKTILRADGTFVEVLTASMDFNEVERAAKCGHEIAQRKEKSLWRKLKRLVGR